MAADFEPGLKAGEEEGEEVQLLGLSSPSNHHWCHQHQHQHQHHRSARLSPLPPRPPWARPAPRFLPFCLKQRGLEGTRRQLGSTNCSNCCPAAREAGREGQQQQQRESKDAADFKNGPRLAPPARADLLIRFPLSSDDLRSKYPKFTACSFLSRL